MPRADKTNLRMVVYNGTEYVAYGNNKYYMNRRDQYKPSLHRQVYIDNFGPIPEGYHVHHIDGDTDNNSIANLVAMPHGEHSKETFAQRWAKPVKRQCKSCGAEFETISNRSEYCSKTCCHREWRRRNSGKVNEYDTRWRAENKDKISKYNKTQKERRRLLNAKSR